MIIIISNEGIFDASGCQIRVSHNELILTSLSSGANTTVAKLDSKEDVIDEVTNLLRAIRDSKKFHRIRNNDQFNLT